MSGSFINVNTEFINWLSYPPAVTTSTLPDGNIPVGKNHPPPLPPMKDSLVNISDSNQTISNIGGIIAKTNVDMTLLIHNSGGNTGDVLTSNGTSFENASWQALPAISGPTGPRGPTGAAGGGGGAGIDILQDTADTTRMPLLYQDFGPGATSVNGNTGITVLSANSALCLQYNPIQNFTVANVDVSASSLSAAQVYGGLINFNPGIGTYSYTLPDGTALSALFGGDANLNIGDSFYCFMSFTIYLLSAQTLTLNISSDNNTIPIAGGLPTASVTTQFSIQALFVFQGSSTWYMYS
jgi:hypothetical protein